ncbi:MAG: magnesium chelatase subunit D, partial [Acidocella sp.]|nr:magnesium chelatase subunit D [Acidocella sp.]
LFAAPSPIRKMPLNISEDRLAGGLDLPATLATGRPIFAPGLLAEASGGVVLVAMAERLSPGIAVRLASAMDAGTGMAENAGTGMAEDAGTGMAVIALDEGADETESAPAALVDRLAFTVHEFPGETPWPDHHRIAAAQGRLAAVQTPEAAFGQLCALASMFGVGSFRAVLLAHRAARAAAAFRGELMIDEADIALAARLVLKPRATLTPQTDTPPQPEPEPEEAQSPMPEGETERPIAPLEDKIAAAETAMLPPDLLAALLAEAGPRRVTRGAGAAGNSHSQKRGRPLGARPGRLLGGARLSLLDTLRAAAPWSRLRARNRPGDTRRIIVRPEDFHIRRFKEQTRRIAIFAVDASGSSALNRLPEAKGAIQLLLADCYIRRDEVALLAFRGKTAALLLPPTHALARVRRALEALPGGGPTPLASGIAAGLRLAQAERRGGKIPLLVVLTDGGANIAQDGTPGRATAGREALAVATACRALKIPALVVDTAPRRQAFVQQLAAEMGGRYMPLPYADAKSLSRAVNEFGGPHAGIRA